MSREQADSLASAIEDFKAAYRKRFKKPSTDGIRADAPLRAEAAELFLALNNYLNERKS